MTRWMRHARAAAVRVWRQQARSGRVWLAVPAAGAVSAASVGEAAQWPDVVGAAVFGLALALAITTVGAPGDDLASGAAAHDLLAGTPPSAMIVGTIGGCMLAMLPACAAVVSAIVASVGGAHSADSPRTIMLGAATMLVGALALAAWFVFLGTLLTGRSAAAITWPLAFAGFVPGDALPLEQWSPIGAAWVRGAWDAMPLPHHVVALERAIGVGQPLEFAHMLPLVLAVVTTPVAAASVLRLRMALGRWG